MFTYFHRPTVEKHKLTWGGQLVPNVGQCFLCRARTERKRREWYEEREMKLTGEWAQALALLDRINWLKDHAPLQSLSWKNANVEPRSGSITRRQKECVWLLARIKALPRLVYRFEWTKHCSDFLKCSFIPSVSIPLQKMGSNSKKN